LLAAMPMVTLASEQGRRKRQRRTSATTREQPSAATIKTLGAARSPDEIASQPSRSRKFHHAGPHGRIQHLDDSEIAR
jgi:hypothetical protein